MGGWSVPGGPGRRVDPCGCGARRTVRNLGDREPGEPCSDKQRRNRKDAPTIRRDIALGAVRVAQRLARRGDLGIAAMAVIGLRGGCECGRRAREIQAIAMAGQRELGPEQRHHREEHGALEPVPMAKAGHDSRLLQPGPMQLIQINPLPGQGPHPAPSREPLPGPGSNLARLRRWTGELSFAGRQVFPFWGGKGWRHLHL